MSDRGHSGGGLRRFLRLLERPGAPIWIVLLGLLMLAPALWTGFVLDDHLQNLMVHAQDRVPELARAPWDMYVLFPGGPSWHAQATELGVVPWYASPDLKAAFMRPLSSLTLYFDRVVVPGQAFPAHLHSFAWFALLCAAAWAFFKRVSPTRGAAALAFFIFVMDENHGLVVAWIANRGSLVALFFAVVGLVFHVRWRTEQWKVGAVLGPLLFAVGLLGGETAIAALAFVFAYAVCLDEGTLWERARNLTGYAGVTVVWRILYKTLGYGTAGSGLYIDPASEPLRFVVAALSRLPVLLNAQLSNVPSELHELGMEWLWVATLVVAVPSLMLLGWLMMPLLRRNARARFWLLAMVLAVVPCCATFATNRLLLPASIAGAGLVAEVVLAFADGPTQESGGRRIRAAAIFFIAMHIVLSPLLLPVDAYKLVFLTKPFEDAGRSMSRGGELEGKTLVLVNPPDFFFGAYAVLLRAGTDLPWPKKIRTLGSTNSPVTVERTGEQELVVSSPGGFATKIFDLALRHLDDRFEVGQQFANSDVSIEMMAVAPNGRPSKIRCTFVRPIDGEDWVWLAWTADGYMPFAVPTVGQTVDLPATTIEEAALYEYDPQLPVKTFTGK